MNSDGQGSNLTNFPCFFETGQILHFRSDVPIQLSSLLSEGSTDRTPAKLQELLSLFSESRGVDCVRPHTHTNTHTHTQTHSHIHMRAGSKKNL